MPLKKYYSGKGDRVMSAMKEKYGGKAERVFYATANKQKKAKRSKRSY